MTTRAQRPAQVARRPENGLAKVFPVSAGGADHGRGLRMEGRRAKARQGGDQQQQVLVVDVPDAAQQERQPKRSDVDHPLLVAFVHEVADRRLRQRRGDGEGGNGEGHRLDAEPGGHEKGHEDRDEVHVPVVEQMRGGDGDDGAFLDGTVAHGGPHASDSAESVDAVDSVEGTSGRSQPSAASIWQLMSFRKRRMIACSSSL